MTSKLNPYLSFDDNAKEAMTFYHSVFGGHLSSNTFGEFGAEGDQADSIMHAQLETEAGYTIMGADTPSEMGQPMPNGAISLSGEQSDGDMLRGYFERLSEGGEVTMPLERQMWGDDFGMVTDRFGVSWMVNIAGTQNG